MELFLINLRTENGSVNKFLVKDYNGKSDYLYWESSTFKISSNEYLLFLVKKKDIQQQAFIKVTLD